VDLRRSQHGSHSHGNLRHLGKNPTQSLHRNGRAQSEFNGFDAALQQGAGRRNRILRGIDHKYGYNARMVKRVSEVFGHYERVPEVAEIQSRKRAVRTIRKSNFPE
jgi:hypothetical protein